MKFLLDNWLLVLIALTSGGMLLAQVFGLGPSAGVPPAEAVRLINREKGVLIDVCEPTEYAQAHAQGARNVPMSQLSGHKDLPANKALPLILICASGSRSARAAAQLRKAGYDKAVSLAGGLKAWREAQLPTASGAKPGASLEAADKADTKGGKSKAKA